jgi:hypothetical protein
LQKSLAKSHSNEESCATVDQRLFVKYLTHLYKDIQDCFLSQQACNNNGVGSTITAIVLLPSDIASDYGGDDPCVESSSRSTHPTQAKSC